MTTSTIILIILGYVLTIFIARYLNYLVYKSEKYSAIATFIWFIPLINVIMFLLILCIIYIENNNKWFTGKHW